VEQHRPQADRDGRRFSVRQVRLQGRAHHPPPTEEEPPRSQFKDKAALIAYVKKSFADGAAAIKAKGDKGLSDSVVDPFAEDNPENAGKDQIRLVDLAYSLVEHSGECYGQLTVYYRAAGIVPPESRPTT